MPIVFRDFGATASRPESADFSADFGPLTAGDALLEFKTTVVRDFANPTGQESLRTGNYIVATEFIASRVSAITMPAALAMNPRPDFIVPQETGTVAGVVANANAPIEWLKGLSSVGTTAPAEWRVSVSSDAPALSEWRTAFSIDTTISAEMLRLYAIAVPASMDSKSTAVAVFPTSAEWRSPVANDTAFQTDSVVSMRTDAIVPWSFAESIQRDDATPTQFLPIILRDDQVTFESGLTPVAAVGDSRVSIEWSSSTFADRVIQTERRTASFRDVGTWSEWTGGAASFDDAVMSIEFGAGVFTTTNAVPAEVIRSVLSEPEVGTISDTSTIAELTPVSEYTLSVLGEDFFFPAANESLWIRDYATPTEWSSAFVTADATFFTGWTRSLAFDFAGLTSWTSTISADTQALVETLTTPVVFFADTVMAVEWTMPVLVDVVVSGDRWFDRESIGASLEPDEWEMDHGG